jgi:protein-S-isoprenylcysteine O-methyltransferase Ste14
MLPDSIRVVLIAFSVVFVAVAGYYRVQSLRSKEHLDRTKEGWPILIGLRLMGLLTIASAAAWLENPASFHWAEWPVSLTLRWFGAVAFAAAIAWLIWMFQTLGRNLTDTVITRRDAYFVDRGPYRLVRNPMYTGVLLVSVSLGLALGTWLLPLLGGGVFALFVLRTRTEEKYLIERFGDQYLQYMQRVGRFFPRLTG